MEGAPRFEKDEYGWLTKESMLAFYAEWRPFVGDDSLGGYGTLVEMAHGHYADT